MPLSVRFSAEELDQLRERAERLGLPVSTLVRRHALALHGQRAIVSLVPTNAPATTGDVGTEQHGTEQHGLQVVGYSGGYRLSVH